MKILIGVPCMDMMHVCFVGSLMCLKKPKGSRTIFVASSLVYDARDQIVQAAIEGGYSHLLFLDSDMVFPDDAIDELLKVDKPIVSGLYFERKGEHRPVAYTDVRRRTIFRKPNATNLNYVPDSVINVDAVGMGCCLIRTDVLKKVQKRYKSCFAPLPGLGEDLSFCHKAVKVDKSYKVYLQPSIDLKHIGTAFYDKTNYSCS